MSYFEMFPYTAYSIDGKTEIVKDILIRSKIVDEIKGYADAYETYTIMDEERPEHVANKFYETPTLHWLILLYNEIHDPYYDWPMSEQELVAYCERMYGKDVMNKVRHYERGGVIIGEYRHYDKDNENEVYIPVDNPGPQDPSVYPVTFIDWESKINDSKREIRILRREFVEVVVSQLQESLGGN